VHNEGDAVLGRLGYALTFLLQKLVIMFKMVV